MKEIKNCMVHQMDLCEFMTKMHLQAPFQYIAISRRDTYHAPNKTVLFLLRNPLVYSETVLNENVKAYSLFDLFSKGGQHDGRSCKLSLKNQGCTILDFLQVPKKD